MNAKRRIKTYEKVDYEPRLSNHDKNNMKRLKHQITDKVNSLENKEKNFELLKKIKEELN